MSKPDTNANTNAKRRGRPKGAKTGTGSVYQRKPGGKYYAIVSVNGKQISRTFNTTNKRKAEQMRAAWVESIQRTKAPSARGNGPVYDGHAQIAAVWESFAPFAENMAPRLRLHYLSTFKRFMAWADAQGIQNAEDVRRSDVVRFLNEVGKGRSVNYTGKFVSQLSRIFGECPANVNPFRDIPQDTGASGKVVGYGNLTDLEVERLREAAAAFDAKKGTDEWLLLFMLAEFTGLRREDICLLRWGSVHLDATVPAIQLIPAKTAKKTGRGVSIPIIDPPLLSALRAKLTGTHMPEGITRQEYMTALAQRAETDMYVLPTIAKIYLKDKETLDTRISDGIRQIFEAAGINRKPYVDETDGNTYKKSFHSYRVRMCSKLANAGCPLALATTIMGHDPKMFLKYFRQDDGEALRYIQRAFWGWDQTGRTETPEEAAQH